MLEQLRCCKNGINGLRPQQDAVPEKGAVLR